ncbi:IS6 family transposase [Haloferax sp. Atlit-6N]|uniref:ISH14-type transposase ISHgi16 n=1 Tax=Haloferax gibbonsii TaxID=35746 RepID=A0A871BLH7_HALGI|nr:MULTISPECIES: IS6 family transposase [Haloferax]QOS13639.1 ISH14-type transposase ISHgi16 [Haloferax gibbonsii]REA02865.1 IS6 family transposase [Haloferax sp. Atlit-6N]
MLLSDLLRDSLDTATLECWQRERTAKPVRAFAVRLHAAGLSLREKEAILRLLGVERSFQAVFQWVHRLSDSVSDPPKATPRRVAVGETAVKINGEWSWLYAAIDLDTKVILDVVLFKRHGTNPAAAFLHGVCETHDCSETVFLADSFGYRTAFSRFRLNGRVDHTDRNLIEKWFQTFKVRVDRFHNSWVGSRLSVRRWLAVFVHYYNFQRPHQSLNGRPPAQEVN